MLKTRPRSPLFEARVAECEEGTCLVECRGEVDIESAPKFRAALDEGLEKATRRLVLDLRGVSFMDSVGVGHIVGAYKRLHRGARLQICTDNDHIRMLLEIAGLHGVSSVHRSKEEALAVL
ncbi:MAG TPA: STAS domain-containing protein [Armatimonadetes bacterium]|jgi:anti-anti-sigma factor|nr:STAS domain-containing protein [Armatimonadota bacterium]